MGGMVAKEPRRFTDESADSDTENQDDRVAEDTSQEPIRIKRTPRLRSGKHEDPDTVD
jgi:hypothetical protein